MSSLSSILEQIRGFDLERAVGLRPPCPEVALELDRTSMTLVRLKSKRRGVRSLEAFKIQSVDDGTVPATMIDPRVVDSEELAGRLRDLFEAAGARPGRVSVVLPDNLAKISLLTLPERPPSRKQLEELVRFKLRRAVPFRMHETVLSYQLIPGEGKSLSILVALVQKNLIERYEQALEAIGAKPGLIDLCTPSILNLCRAQLEADGSDADVALLNCTRNYFSLVILRNGRLIFFRCKTYSMQASPPPEVNGLLAREIGSSLSYYEEKLDGRGIKTLLVRSADPSMEEVWERLNSLEVDEVRAVDPISDVTAAPEQKVDASTAQRIAPALGAVVGRD